MKTFLPFNQILKKTVIVFAVIVFGTTAQAQTTNNELVFSNPVLEPNSVAAGLDGATYRFPLVNSTTDALVKIAGRSSSAVTLTAIDLTGTGFDKAFQPQVTYTESALNLPASWWMEFDITFVTKNTTTPANIASFYASALDIDGDGNTLAEWDSFYGASGYTLENNSLLQITNITELIGGLLQNVGKTFNGVVQEYPGIDTTITQIMVTNRYINKNTFKYRAGATATNLATVTNRKYSVWFKDFVYNAPLTTLPVKLTSFTASLNNSKADLKWETASEINVSHFAIEKSTDGKNFSDAGIIFAYGNATDKANYSFSDNVNTAQAGVLYYRLRSIDVDGKSELSATRIIRIGKPTEKNITILTYPNPVSNEVRITIPATWQNKKVVYEIFNANGLSAKRIETANSSQTETININSFAPGFYIVRVSFDGQTAQQKIVKQ